MPEPHFYAQIAWDAEAGVWYIAETDFPGLVAEAETEDALVAKIRQRIPDLYEANKHLISWLPNGDLPIHVMASRLEMIHIAG